MKVAETQVDIEQSDNLQTGTFSIDFDAKMADMLSNKIYSDPILAVVREYFCNAVDAMNMVPIKRPIDIILPNSMNPTWGVRDYGPGLSQEQIMGTAPEYRGLFNTYGRSDKSGSNNAIGGFGLGSKAGFAYVKKEGAFTVTSFHGGYKKVYTCHRNAKGIPSVTLMATAASNEPTGVSIAVPVDSADFRTFKDRTAHVLSYMIDVAYTLHGDTLHVSKPDYLYKGSNWGYNTNTSGLRVVMGGIAYTVDRHQINGGNSYSHLDILAPIGSVELSVSREGLSYEGSTIAYIEKQLAIICAELADIVKTDIENAPSLLEASKRYHNIITQSALGSMVRGHLPTKWKGRKLLYMNTYGETIKEIRLSHGSPYNYATSKYELKNIKLGIHRLPLKQYENMRFFSLSGYKATNTKLYIKDKNWDVSHGFNINDNYTFVYFDECDVKTKRLHTIGRKDIAAKLILVKGCSYRAFLNLVAKIGKHHTYCKLSETAPYKAPKDPNTVPYKPPVDDVRWVYRMNSSDGSSSSSRYWFLGTQLALNDKTTTKFYLPCREETLYSEFSDTKSWTQNKRNVAELFEQMFPNEKLYLIPFTYKRKVTENSTFVNFYDFIENKFNEFCKNDKFLDVAFTIGSVSTPDFHYTLQAAKFITDNPKLKGTFFDKLVNTSLDIKLAYSVSADDQALFNSLVRVLGKNTNTVLAGRKALFDPKDVLDNTKLGEHIPLVNALDSYSVFYSDYSTNLVDLIEATDKRLKGKK